MKKTALVALVAMSASLMADAGLPVLTPVSYNPSARPALENNGVTAFGGLLYLKADQEATAWAVDSNKSPKDARANWDLGWRVGLGYELPQDAWSAQLAYTHFRAHKKDKAASVSTDGVSDLAAATYKRSLQLSVLDADIGHSYRINENLAVRPHVALRSAWVKQSGKAQFTAADSTVTPFAGSSEYWGMGPNIGMNSTWSIAKVDESSFTLFGGLSTSLLAGSGKVKSSNQTFKKDSVNPVVEAKIGLGWEMNIQDESILAVKLGYESQYWFGQNQQPRLDGNAAADLAVHGISLEAGFNF
jgi:hypothetical protein